MILHCPFFNQKTARGGLAAVFRPGLGAIFLALSVLVCLGGCQGYTDDSGSRTPGEFTDDVGISGNVKAKLLKDPEVRAFKINVDVRKRVVYLFGRVATEAQRMRALSLAQSVKGVVRVEDRLALVEE